MSPTGRRSRRSFLKGTAATGLAASLAGCTIGQVNAPNGSGTVVQFVADSGAKGVSDAINDALHNAGLPGDISVEILAVPSSTAQQQYSQWLAAGLEQPSLFRMDSGWTMPFIVRDQVVNLSEEMPDLANRVEENFFQASVETLSGRNGGLHGIPFFSDFGLILYRKDLVEKAGFDPSGWATNPLTWRQFAEVTKQTKQQAGTPYGFSFQAPVAEALSCCTFNEWMTTWGGSYFGAKENLINHVGERPVTVDAEPSVTASRMARTFIEGVDDPYALEGMPGNIAPQAVLGWNYQASLSAFMDGDAVTHRNWPYSVLSAGAESAFGENLGVMPMPYGVPPEEARFDGMGGSCSALGGWHVTLNPHAKYPDAAKEVLRAMSTDSFYLRMMEEMGYVPPKPNLVTSQQAKNIDVVSRYVDTLRFAGQHAVPRPVSVVWPRESPRIAQQVSGTISGGQAPEPALQDLKETLVEIENSAAETRRQN